MSHFFIVVTAVAFGASTQQTLRAAQSLHDDTLTPNQKTMLLAKKWREERNFWIAFLAFILWCLLARFYHIARRMIQLEDRERQLEERLRELEGQATGTAPVVEPVAPKDGSAQTDAPLGPMSRLKKAIVGEKETEMVVDPLSKKTE